MDLLQSQIEKKIEPSDFEEIAPILSHGRFIPGHVDCLPIPATLKYFYVGGK